MLRGGKQRCAFFAGLPYGTIAARIEDTVLRFLPRFIKRRIVVRA